jgi:hypothetical protein
MQLIIKYVKLTCRKKGKKINSKKNCWNCTRVSMYHILDGKRKHFLVQSFEKTSGITIDHLYIFPTHLNVFFNKKRQNSQ